MFLLVRIPPQAENTTDNNVLISTRQKDSSFGLQTHQGLISLVFTVFQPMAFVTEYKADLAAMQDLGMQPKRFVGNDQHGVDGPAAERVHEASQVTVDVTLAPAVNRQRSNLFSQPFSNFVEPIFDEAAWRHDYSFVY